MSHLPRLASGGLKASNPDVSRVQKSSIAAASTPSEHDFKTGDEVSP